MVVTCLDVNGALDQHRPFNLGTVTSHTQCPSSAWLLHSAERRTWFLNARTADYLGPKDHPQQFGTDTGADWDSNLCFFASG